MDYFHSATPSFEEYLKVVGGKLCEGYQLRYVYFIDKKWKRRLTVPIMPFSEIGKVGAGMYKGERK